MGVNASKMISKTVNDIYRESLTSILSQSSTTISNVMSSAQNIDIRFKCREVYIGCGFTQNIIKEIKLLNSVSESQVFAIQSMMTADIENRNSQVMKSVYEILSSVGTYNSSELTNEFTTRLKNIVKNSVTVETTTRIMNNFTVTQDLKLLVEGDVCVWQGEDCKSTQTMMLKYIGENIVNNIVEVASSDSSLTRIINENSQNLQTESKGLGSLISGLVSIGAIVFVASIVGLYITTRSASGGGASSVSEIAKSRPGVAALLVLVTILLPVIVIYVVVAYFKGFWPFQSYGLWGCEKKDGKSTGACIKYAPGEIELGFKTKEACDAAVRSGNACQQNWGCAVDVDGKYTGHCAQYSSVLSGPYKTKMECEENIKTRKACVYGYGFKRSNGQYEEPPSCVEYTDPKLGIYSKKSTCEENLSKAKNRWKCSRGKQCVVVNPDDGEWGPYESKSTCEMECK